MFMDIHTSYPIRPPFLFKVLEIISNGLSDGFLIIVDSHKDFDDSGCDFFSLNAAAEIHSWF